MAGLPSNCERNLMNGKYIAYDAAGFAWRVSKTGFGEWAGQPSHLKHKEDKRYAKENTLKEICAGIGRSVPTFNKGQ